MPQKAGVLSKVSFICRGGCAGSCGGGQIQHPKGQAMQRTKPVKDAGGGKSAEYATHWIDL